MPVVDTNIGGGIGGEEIGVGGDEIKGGYLDREGKSKRDWVITERTKRNGMRVNSVERAIV